MSRGTTVALFLTALAFALVACGVDEEATLPRMKPGPAKSDLSKMSPADRAAENARQNESTKDMFMWPEGRPSSPDVVADLDSCRAMLMQTEYYANSNELIQFVSLVRCMTDKGWDVDQERVQALHSGAR